MLLGRSRRHTVNRIFRVLFTRISPEFHQNFTGKATKFAFKVDGGKR